MNDRELLEKAARVAGPDIVWTDCDGNFYTGEPERLWQPLEDDGDAFRLMVLIGHDECVDYIRGALEACDIEPVGCRLAATRRAISMAAALLADEE